MNVEDGASTPSTVLSKRGRGRPKKRPYKPNGMPNLTATQAEAAAVEADLLPPKAASPRRANAWIVHPKNVAARAGCTERAVRKWRRLPAYRDAVLAAMASRRRCVIEEMAAEITRRLDARDEERRPAVAEGREHSAAVKRNFEQAREMERSPSLLAAIERNWREYDASFREWTVVNGNSN
jgi:hypothetical protein